MSENNTRPTMSETQARDLLISLWSVDVSTAANREYVAKQLAALDNGFVTPWVKFIERRPFSRPAMIMQERLQRTFMAMSMLERRSKEAAGQ